MLKKIFKLLSYSNITFFLDIFYTRRIKKSIIKTVDHNFTLSDYPNNDFFEDNLLINTDTIIRSIDINKNTKEVLDVLNKLENDQFNLNRIKLYNDGLNKFNHNWFYLDLPLILNHIVKITKPRNYLEVGVRRGRSLAIVANQNPKINITAVDLWVEDYAGAENPGENLVINELKKFNFQGKIDFYNANSRKVLKQLINNNKFFDLITIDGDHSPIGAQIDLRNAKRILKKGGLIVFDDISNPYHPFLKKIYEKEIHNNIQFNSYFFDAGGYGIGIAIKKY